MTVAPAREPTVRRSLGPLTDLLLAPLFEYHCDSCGVTGVGYFTEDTARASAQTHLCIAPRANEWRRDDRAGVPHAQETNGPDPSEKDLP